MISVCSKEWGKAPKKGNFAGHSHSKSAVEKISATLKEYNKTHTNGMKGHKYSKKDKLKLSLAVKKYHLNPVNKEKFSLAHIGKKHSKETKTKIKAARAKQVIPFRDTKIEIALQKELKRRKITFKKHVSLIGQPDIFIEPNVCIFADGDYWHNRQGSQSHDLEVTRKLTEQNYFVLRFWGSEINKDIKSIGDRIEKLIKN